MGRIDKAVVSLTLKKYQTLKNGEHPVVIRVYSNGRQKLYATGLSSSPGKWDEEQSRFKRNKKLNGELSELETRAKRTVDSVIHNFGNFSFEKFDQSFRQKPTGVMFIKYWEAHVKKLRNENRSGTASSYQDALRKFSAYRKHKDLPLIEIDKAVFNGFAGFMKQSGQSTNGIGVYLRAMNAVYGAAITDGIISPAHDARQGIKVKTEATPKRALSKGNMMKIIHAALPVGRQHESRNMFVFSYYCQGIKFKDLCSLTWKDNIVEDRIVYRKNKSGGMFSVKINGKLRTILDECREARDSSPLGYVFPVYVDPKLHVTEEQQKKRRDSRAKMLNKDLREILVTLGIVELDKEELQQFNDYRFSTRNKLGATIKMEVPNKLKHYSYQVARHTYATVLKKSGVKTSLISEGLGQSSEHITQVYLDSFDNDELDRAQEALD